MNNTLSESAFSRFKQKSPKVLLFSRLASEEQSARRLLADSLTSKFSDAIVVEPYDLPAQDSFVFQTMLDDSIADADVVVGDVTGGNINVFFALGKASAMKDNQSIILIGRADRALSIPSDFAHLLPLIYSFDNPEFFQISFANRVNEILNPGSSSSSEDVQSKTNVFISYSHNDSKYLQRLQTHLKPLQSAGLVDIWSDTRLNTGDLWEQEIEQALKRASIAILLISADFMASDFIIKNELPPILAKAEAEGTRILSILVKPSRFSRDKKLNRFQAANSPTLTLSEISEAEQERIYDRVVQEVEKFVPSQNW